MNLSRTVCTVHPERPAAARCPKCRQFFCSGCVTEHEGRLTCAACIARGGSPEPALASQSTGPGRAGGTRLIPLLQILAGIALAWAVSWFMGRLITSIPSDFHDGTRWETHRRR
ncbi:MAG: rhomboid family protein [Verrucomicrobiales bacterium]